MKDKLTLSEAQRTGRMDEFMREEQARLDKEKKRGKESVLRRVIKRMTRKSGQGD